MKIFTYLKENDEEIVNGINIAETLSILKKRKDEYVYLESDQENEIKGFVLEWDEVFSTYTILVGLPVKKKHTQNVKEYLQNTLQGNFNVMYDDGEGFLDVNVSIESLHTIQEEMTIRQVSETVTKYIDQLMTVTKEA